MANSSPESTQAHTWQSFHFESISSTMDTALDIVRSPLTRRLPLYVTCDHQTKGRGRYDREWESQKGNVLVTYAIETNFKSLVPYYPYLAALALYDTLLPLISNPKSHLSLKWPNDILIDDQKCGGILIEAHHDQSIEHPGVPTANDNQATILLIGVGVNVVYVPENLPYPATKLCDHRNETKNEDGIKDGVKDEIKDGREYGSEDKASRQKPPHPETIARLLAQRISHWQTILENEGFAPLKTEWLLRRNTGHNQMSVQIRGQDEPVSGTFHNLNDQGQLELMCTLDDGTSEIKIINSGDTFFL